MDQRRFDRLTRRAAMAPGATAAGLAGLAGPAAPVPGQRLRVQEATPAADATPAAGSSATLAAPDAEFLYVQVAPDATWAPKPGVDGVYVLTLTHRDGQTVYFSDRPERLVGTAATADFIANLGFTPADPPNAAIVAGEEVLVVELTNPVYDAVAGTLAYDATPLPPEETSAGLSHLANRQTDAELPQDLGPTSLFIDNRQCGEWVHCLKDGSVIGQIPGGPYPACLQPDNVTCIECFSTPPVNVMQQSCGWTYAECADDVCTIDFIQ